MIPRTSIDEANRHLMALHHRVNQLENTIREQNEALHMKDEWLKTRVADIEASKKKDVTKLTEKLVASEKTVDILQEQLRQKHQQVAVLQRSCRLLKNLVSFRTNVRELFQCMDEAEKDMSSQRDLLNLYQEPVVPNVTNSPKSPAKSSGVYVNTNAMVNAYPNHVDMGNNENGMEGSDTSEEVWKVMHGRQAASGERGIKKKGKEFYL